MKNSIKLFFMSFLMISFVIRSAIASEIDDLCTAAQTGDLEKVKFLISSGVDINEKKQRKEYSTYIVCKKWT